MSDTRNDLRTPMKCQVKVSHDSIGDILVNTRDISDGGVFLLTEAINMPPVGTIVQGQVQGMGMVAPILKMQIIRIEPSGIGLKFINE
ncbi:MAG: hypothetical protein ACJASG_001532 [Oleiphilaceae bacterium]|jgi:hypothetical protein